METTGGNVKRKKTKKEIFLLLLGFLLIAVLYFFFGCPFYYFTGIPCPGCGTSRALMSLARLDFTAAFYFHPMVFFLPLLAIALFWRKGFLAKPIVRNVIIGIFGAAYIGLYIYRFFIEKSPVVSRTVPPFANDILRLVNLFR